MIDSAEYWEARYRRGKTSGAGSYGRLAAMKAAVINDLIEENEIESVIDFGCGDGNQLSLMTPVGYLGVDVSETALDRLRRRFAAQPLYAFRHADALEGVPRADLALSLDVIYHLVEDAVFETYMRRLFLYARRFVVVYSSNVERPYRGAHIRHRRFTDFVAARMPEWQLARHLPNPFPWDPADQANTSFSDFFVFAAPGETLWP